MHATVVCQQGLGDTAANTRGTSSDQRDLARFEFGDSLIHVTSLKSGLSIKNAAMLAARGATGK
jgi:hypothetical protein